MRKPQGYGIIVDPSAPTREFDTLTCAHCNKVYEVRPFQDPTDAGGFCRRCMRHVCGPCADYGTCVPFEKALEAHERGILRSLSRQDLFRALG